MATDECSTGCCMPARPGLGSRDETLRRVMFVGILLAVAAAVLWGPTYVRGASFVVRAAHMDGWMAHALAGRTGGWRTGDVTTIPTRHGPIPARLYQPDGTSRRAVLLTPGVHAMGVDEPRLKGLATDLARSGLTVLTIALPDLVHYRFAPASVDEIEDAAGWLHAARSGPRRPRRADGHQLRRRAVRCRRRPALSARPRGVRLLVRRPRQPAAGASVPRAPVSSPRARRTSSQDPPHFRAPHDYGVAVILLGLADRVVPPDQVEPLRVGIETYLTRVPADAGGHGESESGLRRVGGMADALPEPSRDADAHGERAQHEGARRAAAPGRRSGAHGIRPPFLLKARPRLQRRSFCCTAPRTRSFPPSRHCCSPSTSVRR